MKTATRQRSIARFLTVACGLSLLASACGEEAGTASANVGSEGIELWTVKPAPTVAIRGTNVLEGAKEFLLDLYEAPEYMPAYRDLFVEPSGRLWAIVSGPGDTVTTLRAATAAGMERELNIPFDLVVFEVRDGYVVGRREEESGEQRVVVYEMERVEPDA